MQKIITAFISLLTLATLTPAETAVWKIEGQDSVAYLGGTCHVLRKADYPLPPEYDAAYRRSSTVVFETDIGEFTKPGVQAKLISRCMYADGRTVEKVLSTQAYQRLATHCDKLGLPLAAMNQMKPAMIVMSITVMEFARHGVSQAGVDMHYHAMAAKDGKTVAGLETVDRQIGFLADMGEGNESELVLHSLDDLTDIGATIKKLLAAWRSGDEKQIEDLFLKDMQKDFPALYNQLIVERNRAWIPRLKNYLDTPDTEFVLVGLAHIVGQDGLLRHLRKHGYKVTRFAAPTPAVVVPPGSDGTPP